MAIDPRRLRRGRFPKQVLRWRILTVAAVAVVAQSSPFGAAAQDASAAVGGGGAPRDPWRIGYGVSVNETWSDNINLQSTGNERSDFVTSISPSISFTRLSSRLTASFNYAPQFLFYANGTNGSQLRNSLSANSRAIVVPNLLTFDAGVAISQQNISPFGTQAANTVNGSTNRAETRSYSFGPTLRSRLDRDLTYSAGYQFYGSGSNNSGYASSHTNVLFGQFQTSTSFRDLGFGGNFNRSDQNYGGSNEIVTEQAGAQATYVVTPSFHLVGNIGYDRSRYPTTGQPDLKGPSYSGGFDWEPTHHTSFNVQVGHRYFGPTANIVLRQTTSKLALTAVYSRDQTTSNGSGLTRVQDPNYALFDQLFLPTIPDPILRAQAVAAALAQFGLPVTQYGVAGFLSNNLFVQKRAQVSLALLGLRNTVTFDVSRTESQGLSAITSGFDVFNQSSRFATTAYSANWSHRLGPRTSLAATVSKSHSQALEGIGDSRQRLFTVSMTRQFQQHLSGSLLYRNTTQTSNNGNSSGFYSGNYRENAVLGSLRLYY